jgi:hypothetical protein
MPPKPAVRVRMYRQGLGDCFLVSFYTGPKPRHMLIDCGTLGATTTEVTMAQVVDNIAQESGGTLDVLIATHEHKDHLSGFNSQRDRFDEIKVKRAWVAWTEDASDELAQEMAKYKKDLLIGVALVADRLGAVKPAALARSATQDLGAVGRELLGFYGDLPESGLFGAKFAETINEAMNYATTRGEENRFLTPGEVLEEPWLPGIRIYVLGPPRDASAIKQMGDHGSTELYGLSAQFALDLAACTRFTASDGPLAAYQATLEAEDRQAFDRGLPFDPRFRVESAENETATALYPSYYGKEDDWRRIDFDWLAGATDLALQLDGCTNNTSLAIAIELVEGRRVLLFPADAQLGNWLSWHKLAFKVRQPDGEDEQVTATDLLGRAVFYKVGHHASHNGTASGQGLELMVNEDLIAAIPVDREVAIKKSPPWWMPAEALYKRLLEKTRGRVLRSDLGWPDDEDRPSTVSKAKWDKARQEAPVKVANGYIDFEF